MTEVVVIVLVMGMVLGFFLGRWWTERLRARADMHRVWSARKNYRAGPFNGIF